MPHRTEMLATITAAAADDSLILVHLPVTEPTASVHALSTSPFDLATAVYTLTARLVENCSADQLDQLQVVFGELIDERRAELTHAD